MRFYTIMAVFLLALAYPSLVHAKCMLTGNDPGERDDGTIVYNARYQTLQICSGGVWRALGPVDTSDPCTRGNPGAECSDGAFYIGEIGGRRVYAAPTDETNTMRWKTINNATPGTSDMQDGHNNTYPALDNATHPAGHACTTKAPAGTWYLPARSELELFWTNRNDINLTGIGINIGPYYWSSTEETNTSIYQRRFSDGSEYNHGGSGKDGIHRVRCVRR